MPVDFTDVEMQTIADLYLDLDPWLQNQAHAIEEAANNETDPAEKQKLHDLYAKFIGMTDDEADALKPFIADRFKNIHRYYPPTTP